MAHSKLYIRLMGSRQWKELRAEWLTAHPICDNCYKIYDIITPAQCVHHVVPIESGRTDADCTRLAFSKTNLQSLCFACHADIHKAERSHSKDAHKQRAAERLERWKQRHTTVDSGQQEENPLNGD